MKHWRYKHPCTACDTGYGFCAAYALHGLKCCKGCDHPGRWRPDEEPYTPEEIAQMKEEAN